MYEEVKQINKIDVGFRLTNQAIKMFFHRDDSISTHVVVCSANEILTTLIKKRNWDTLLGPNSLIIRPSAKKKWINARKEKYNFFKHANKDSSDCIDFNPNFNRLLIFENINFITMLNIDRSKEMVFFNLWLSIYKRDFFERNKKIDEEIEKLNLSGEEMFNHFDELINLEWDYKTIQNLFSPT